MRVLPIFKIKDKVNEYVDAVALTHDQITITKNGAPAAVLVGADECETLLRDYSARAAVRIACCPALTTSS
jgi:prevent-host-death family protein